MASSIKFAVSDGDSTHRPSEDTNYTVAPREPLVEYKAKLGKLIGARLEGYKAGMVYTVKNLPAGYELYQRARAKNAFTKIQIDRFLYGHPDRYIFRSTNEFAPHALWLANGQKGPCTCFGCNGGRKKGTASKPVSLAKATSRVASSNASTSASELASREKPTPTADLQKKSIFTKYLTELRTAQEMDIFIQEPDNLPWRIEHKNFRPTLSTIPTQGAFIPRAGEIVLFTEGLPLQTGYLPNAPHASPIWKAGIITSLPHAETPPFTINEIIKPNDDKDGLAINYSGFRVEIMSDPNSHIKDSQLRWSYLPLSHLRPFCFYRELLANTPKKEWDASISNALKTMSTFSLALPIKFVGAWPDAWILHGGIYLGSEIIMAGDAVRVAPSAHSPASEEAPQQKPTTVLIVSTVTLMLQGLDLDPPHHKLVTGDKCENITVRFHGKLFSRESSPSSPAAAASVSQEQRGGDDDGGWTLPPSMRDEQGRNDGWYPVSSDKDTLHFVPLAIVLGRLYEPAAIFHYGLTSPTPLPPPPPPTSSQHNSRSGAVFDANAIDTATIGTEGVLKARAYARKHDERITALGVDGGGWFWANDRVEGLGVEAFGEEDVGGD